MDILCERFQLLSLSDAVKRTQSVPQCISVSIRSLPYELRICIYDLYIQHLSDPRDLYLAYLHQPHRRPLPKKLSRPCSFGMTSTYDIRVLCNNRKMCTIHDPFSNAVQHCISQLSDRRIEHFRRVEKSNKVEWEKCDNCSYHQMAVIHRPDGKPLVLGVRSRII